MKLITCASYYGTGSSAIGDILSEVSIVEGGSDFEVSFLHTPYGISDLEYYLIENPNRHNSSFALKNFLTLIEFLAGNKLFKKYDNFFKGDWKSLAYEYATSLTTCTYNSSWQFDMVNKPLSFYYFSRFLYKIFKIDLLKKEKYFCTITDSDEFINKTQLFVKKLLKSLSQSHNYLFIDQLVPSSNIERYLRYINYPTFVFLVDRDPRDIYLLEKYIWKTEIVPTRNVEDFCQWFKFIRCTQEKEKQLTDNVSYVQFEDLIYHYGNSLDSIFNWLGIEKDNHIAKKQKFNPFISLNNTRLWERYPKEHKEIEYIENQLENYLYSYTDDDKLFHKENFKNNLILF